MSWDLVFWKGAPTEEPPDVWEALANSCEVRFLRPLRMEETRRAFVEEYGDDIRIESNSDGQATFMGRGWECGLSDGDKYLHVTCSWGFAQDDDRLTQLVRAGMRAGCYVFDPQSSHWWEPPESDWVPDDFDVWDSVQGNDS